MCGSVALFISALIPQLKNFASMINVIISSMFLASSSLYPLWRIRAASEAVCLICWCNPSTHAAEFVRRGLYLSAYPLAALVVIRTAILFFGLAILVCNPTWHWARRG